MSVGDKPTQVPGRRVAPALAEVVRDLPHAAAGQVKDRPRMRQQHGVHRPVRGQFRIGGNRGLDQGRGGLFPPGGHVRGYVGQRDGLHQPVHRHQPVPGRDNQREPAQRHHRVVNGQLILQQRYQHGHHVAAEIMGESGTGTRL
jgi:hypothetical protein